MTKLNEVQIKLAEQLLISVKNKEPIVQYNELASRIDPPIHWRQVGKHIGEISKVCHELGLPLLSAKVVNKNSQRAGDGFYPLYAMLGIPTEGMTEKELFRHERDAIRNCKEWYKLEDYLGLQIGFERPEGTENEEPRINEVEGSRKEAIIQDSLTPKFLFFSHDDAEDERLVSELKTDALTGVSGQFRFKGVAKEKPAPIEMAGRKTYPRDKQTAINALSHAAFRCEIDSSHPTFLRRYSNKPYTEPHHLVPMAFSDEFDVSLDVEENIVSLCSNCHNHIHYGQGADKMIENLFSERKDDLKRVGIDISLEQLLNYYSYDLHPTNA